MKTNKEIIAELNKYIGKLFVAHIQEEIAEYYGYMSALIWILNDTEYDHVIVDNLKSKMEIQS